MTFKYNYPTSWFSAIIFVGHNEFRASNQNINSDTSYGHDIDIVHILIIETPSPKAKRGDGMLKCKMKDSSAEFRSIVEISCSARYQKKID